MTDFLAKVKNALSFLSKNLKTILLVIFAGLAIYFFIDYQRMKSNYKSDIIVLSDSLTTYKAKNKELYAAQQTYIASEKELKKINEDLYKEIKNLKDHPLIVTKTEYVFKRDTINTVITDYIQKDSTVSYNWNFNDQWTSINGISSFDLGKTIGFTTVNSLSLSTNLILDVIEKNKQLQIIAKTDNPYCTINTINGAIISPEKISSINSRIKNQNRWGLGIQVGIGAAYYQQQILAVPYIGFGLSYNLITF